MTLHIAKQATLAKLLRDCSLALPRQHANLAAKALGAAKAIEAKQAMRQASQRKPAKRAYVLQWAGGAAANVQGDVALAAALGMATASIPVLLSRGAGSFTLHRINPATGNAEVVTVACPDYKPRPRLA